MKRVREGTNERTQQVIHAELGWKRKEDRINQRGDAAQPDRMANAVESVSCLKAGTNGTQANHQDQGLDQAPPDPRGRRAPSRSPMRLNASQCCSIKPSP